jgi:hypothetical protein
MAESTGAPRSDDELLDIVAKTWEQLDPPPADLADGVLARLAAQDLEYELLTLVEGDEALTGVRSTATVTRAPDETGTWSLEYLGQASACSCGSRAATVRRGSTAGSPRRSR